MGSFARRRGPWASGDGKPHVVSWRSRVVSVVLCRDPQAKCLNAGERRYVGALGAAFSKNYVLDWILAAEAAGGKIAACFYALY